MTSLKEEIMDIMITWRVPRATEEILKLIEKRIDQERMNLSIDNSEFANGWNHALGQLKFKIQHDQS